MSDTVWDVAVDGPEPVPLPAAPFVPTLVDADAATYPIDRTVQPPGPAEPVEADPDPPPF
jgi:hypothetical protein